MLRSLLALMLGWCVLSLVISPWIFDGAAAYSSYVDALPTAFGLNALVVLGVLLAAIIMATVAKRWPNVRAAGAFALPILGAVLAGESVAWLARMNAADIPVIIGVFGGAGLGAFAERWSPGAQPFDCSRWSGYWIWELLKTKWRELDDANVILPPRIVTGLCLVQIIAVCVGTCATRQALHSLKREPLFRFEYVSSKIPIDLAFVSSFGLWFLLVPLIWSGWAAATAHRAGGTVDITVRQALLGLTLAVAGVFFFACSALHGVALATDLGGPLVGYPQ